MPHINSQIEAFVDAAGKRIEPWNKQLAAGLGSGICAYLFYGRSVEAIRLSNLVGFGVSCLAESTYNKAMSLCSRSVRMAEPGMVFKLTLNAALYYAVTAASIWAVTDADDSPEFKRVFALAALCGWASRWGFTLIEKVIEKCFHMLYALAVDEARQLDHQRRSPDAETATRKTRPVRRRRVNYEYQPGNTASEGVQPSRSRTSSGSSSSGSVSEARASVVDQAMTPEEKQVAQTQKLVRTLFTLIKEARAPHRNLNVRTLYPIYDAVESCQDQGVDAVKMSKKLKKELRTLVLENQNEVNLARDINEAFKLGLKL